MEKVRKTVAVATGEGAIPPHTSSDQELEAVAASLSLVPEDELHINGDPDSPPHSLSLLHTAAMCRNIPLAELLLSHGGDPWEGRLMGAEGGHPVALALFYAATEMARFLAGEDEDATRVGIREAAGLGWNLDPYFHPETQGLTPAARKGFAFYRPIPAFPELDERSAKDDQVVLDEALSWAARNNQIGSMERLVAAGAVPNAIPYGGTPLLWAIYSDSEDAAAWLLQAGADPDLVHDFGGSSHGKSATALHLAAQYESLACLRLLLDAGASTDIKDAAWNGTPLDWAVHCQAPRSEAILRAHVGLDKATTSTSSSTASPSTA